MLVFGMNPQLKNWHKTVIKKLSELCRAPQKQCQNPMTTTLNFLRVSDLGWPLLVGCPVRFDAGFWCDPLIKKLA
jgi:hypothetical protein